MIARWLASLQATVAAWFTWERWGIQVDDLEPHAPGDALYLATRQAYKRAVELELEAAMAWRRHMELAASLATREAARALATGTAPAPRAVVHLHLVDAPAWQPEAAVHRLRRRR
jgi:hypothetical protein